MSSTIEEEDEREEEEWDLDTDEIRSLDSDELYESRPNRWRGPQDSWRHLTEPERWADKALNRRRNEDLSIHLYNVFALKRRKKPTGHEDAPSPSRQVGKQRRLHGYAH